MPRELETKYVYEEDGKRHEYRINPVYMYHKVDDEPEETFIIHPSTEHLWPWMHKKLSSKDGVEITETEIKKV